MIHDIVIIGGGPCGLAVAARLRESAPAALFTDDEHARYWKRFNRKETIENEQKSARKQCNRSENAHRVVDDPLEKSIIVLDGHSDQWMSAWRERFRALQIEQLRSPLFFHPDPRDRDGLLSFAHSNQRTTELEVLDNIVGREISKHRTKKKRDKRVARHLRIDDRDRIDYFTPSSRLFEDYCDEIVTRYRLEGLVRHAKVDAIEYGDVGDRSAGALFSISTSDGQFYARIVVLAVGSGSKPCIPPDHKLNLGVSKASVCHCFENARDTLLPRHVLENLGRGQQTCVVVVGGGLTSAQIADLLVRWGVSKVWLLTRGKYKVKHFDVDLDWVSKVRNQQMSVFWSADTDEERAELLKTARNGGSITPKFDKILKRHVQRQRLEVLTHTKIVSGQWSESAREWSLQVEPDHSELGAVDHIIYATGTSPRIEKVDCMNIVSQQHPVGIVNGLPQITQDLMWNDAIPLFVTGGLGALRLGPGAANLAGARQGAERIAWKVEEILPRKGSRPGNISNIEEPRPFEDVSSSRKNFDRDLEMNQFTGGFSNHFQTLACDPN